MNNLMILILTAFIFCIFVLALSRGRLTKAAKKPAQALDLIFVMNGHIDTLI